jgi:hypothetical protein
MTLVGGIAPSTLEEIRAPLILGLPRPQQRTIAVALVGTGCAHRRRERK